MPRNGTIDAAHSSCGCGVGGTDHYRLLQEDEYRAARVAQEYCRRTSGESDAALNAHSSHQDARRGDV